MDAWKGEEEEEEEERGGGRRSKTKIIIWRVRDWLIVFCFCFFSLGLR